MKAKVSGLITKMNYPEINIFLEDDTCEIIEQGSHGTYLMYKGFLYRTYSSMIKPIKEITITEEEFDKAYNEVIMIKPGTSTWRDRLKEELFKDVK